MLLDFFNWFLVKLYELCNFFLKTWATSSLDCIFPPSIIFCLIILTSAGLFFPLDELWGRAVWLQKQWYQNNRWLSFIFYSLPQGSLYHLSVIKQRALTLWIVVNCSKRHNRQKMFMKHSLILWSLKFSHFALRNYHLENM